MTELRKQELAWLAELQALYPSPKRGLPAYEARYESCCRWALAEIRRRLVLYDGTSAFYILTDFYDQMQEAVAESGEPCPTPRDWQTPGATPAWAGLGFSVGMGIAEYILQAFDERAHFYELNSEIFEVDLCWKDIAGADAVCG